MNSSDVENPDDVYNTVELNRDSRRYIHVKVLNKIKYFINDGKDEKVDNKYYDLMRCSEDYFHTPYEKEFYNRNKHKYHYCIENSEVYL